ncbi:hypothetical protein EV146_11676 [Mesobacillus foraminis]|uniref:Uncharacterized protein n=2 Tax=Mesobacillus foraminis TaxID=279826 RepID=A0A4R2B0D3_9BACI|nr:hypothetical protein EV146_11676 [Mesobacillus foraminis]
MLLHYYDVKVSKMEYGISLGNPYYGFVENMNSLITQVGIIMNRLAEIAKEYLGEHVSELTGGTFDEILNHV